MSKPTAIQTAIQSTIDAVIAHIDANPNQTQSQACYLAGASNHLDTALAPLRDAPIGQRPYIAISSEIRGQAIYSAFRVAVQEGRLVRTGWRAGSAVYSTPA